MDNQELLQAERMILLGAAGRNLGKTQLAVRLIGRYARTHEVVGVKVITVEHHGDACPRGGRGCGICHGLKGAYDIREEQAKGDKDTQKFLEAGARKSYLVRALPEGLSDAMRDLLNQIPEHAVIICESNRVRTVLKPGAFLMLQSHDGSRKPSAERVWDLADKIVETGEEEFQNIVCCEWIKSESERNQ